MKSYAKPPQKVEMVLEAVLILLQVCLLMVLYLNTAFLLRQHRRVMILWHNYGTILKIIKTIQKISNSLEVVTVMPAVNPLSSWVYIDCLS